MIDDFLMSPEAYALRYQTPSARALYLHIPFCVRKCLYCDFDSQATADGDDLMRRYVIGLQHLIEHAAYIGLLDECTTGYVGGGTPSMLRDWLGWLCETVDRSIEVSELTCEANPESLDERLVHTLANAGATRLSLGIQSFSPRELRALGRIHGAKTARRALELAVSSGLAVSCDLMCGIPMQSARSWRNSVAQVLEAGVGHISAYSLIIEEGTPFAEANQRGELTVGDDDAVARRMLTVERMASQAGLQRYEVASYARKGQECRHNKAYWSGQPYLGLGTSAASMLTKAGYERLKGACPSLPEMPVQAVRARLRVRSRAKEIACDGGLAALSFEVEFLNHVEAIAEDLMLAMRKTDGAPAALIELGRTCVGVRVMDEALADVTARGLVEQTPTGGFAPTRRGWLLGNALFARMWDLAK